MTYPDPAVSSLLRDRFIGLKLPIKHPKVRELTIIWLPTLIVFDKRGVEHGRNPGSITPPELLDFLDLAEARARMREAKYARADALLAAALSRRPTGPLTDELLYWRGISRYFLGGRDQTARAESWRELLDRFPNSIWSHRIPDPQRLADATDASASSV